MKKRYHDDMSMDEIMRLWPAAIRVVLDHGLLCVGCPIASFHTVDDAIREHGIEGKRFREALRAVVEGDRAGERLSPDRAVPPPEASAYGARSRSPAGGCS